MKKFLLGVTACAIVGIIMTVSYFIFWNSEKLVQNTRPKNIPPQTQKKVEVREEIAPGEPCRYVNNYLKKIDTKGLRCYLVLANEEVPPAERKGVWIPAKIDNLFADISNRFWLSDFTKSWVHFSSSDASLSFDYPRKSWRLGKNQWKEERFMGIEVDAGYPGSIPVTLQEKQPNAGKTLEEAIIEDMRSAQESWSPNAGTIGDIFLANGVDRNGMNTKETKILYLYSDNANAEDQEIAHVYIPRKDGKSYIDVSLDAVQDTALLFQYVLFLNSIRY